jgi:hypothetical protein
MAIGRVIVDMEVKWRLNLRKIIEFERAEYLRSFLQKPAEQWSQILRNRT